MKRPILELKNIIKEFAEVRAVDGIDLSIESGICFGLLGPNGAGKTTLFEVIEGTLTPTSGEILYKGKPRKRRFKEEVGVQFQHTEFPHFLTVKETLISFRNLYKHKADLDYLIEACYLQDLLDRDNRKISGGQKQRLLLAIALANDPDLIFLDEPTTGLDPQSRRHLWEIVKQIKSKNKTVILTTHYMDEAQTLCDKIAIMDLGKFIAEGSPKELLLTNNKTNFIVLEGDIDKDILIKLPWPWKKLRDKIEIYTNNVNDCIKILLEMGIDLSGISARTQNLEDLFIKLTGKELRA